MLDGGGNADFGAGGLGVLAQVTHERLGAAADIAEFLEGGFAPLALAEEQAAGHLGEAAGGNANTRSVGVEQRGIGLPHFGGIGTKQKLVKLAAEGAAHDRLV